MGPGPRCAIAHQAGTTKECFRMSSSVTAASSLKQVQGTIALAGAGKMGGAMLTGWLAQRLDPKRVVVIEPHPSAEINTLAAKGVRLNPAATQVGEDDTLGHPVTPDSC